MTNAVDHLSDDMLNELLDEALAPQMRPAVEAHLAGCLDCAARLETMRSLFARLASLPDLPLERDLSLGVVNALRRGAGATERPARAPWLARLIFGGQAIAAVLLLAFAWPVVSAFAAQLPMPFTAPGLSPIFGEISRLLVDLRALAANPLSLWVALQHWLAAVPASVGALLPAWLQPLGAALVVAAAGGIWLLGNALVLSPPLLARLRRHS